MVSSIYHFTRPIYTLCILYLVYTTQIKIAFSLWMYGNGLKHNTTEAGLFPCAAQYKSSQCNKLYLSDMYLSDLAYIVMLHLNRGPS